MADARAFSFGGPLPRPDPAGLSEQGLFDGQAPVGPHAPTPKPAEAIHQQLIG